MQGPVSNDKLLWPSPKQSPLHCYIASVKWADAAKEFKREPLYEKRSWGEGRG